MEGGRKGIQQAEDVALHGERDGSVDEDLTVLPATDSLKVC